MFQNVTKDQKFKLYERLALWTRFDREVKVVDVDFNEPWYQILLSKPGMLGLNLLNVIIFSATNGLVPIIIAYIISTGRISLIWYLLAGLLIERVIVHWLFRYHPLYQNTIVRSLAVSAYQKLIMVDPEFHATKSSGQIISKINRGSNAVQSFIGVVFFSILSAAVQLTTISISIFIISPWVGLTLFVVFILMMSYTMIMFRIRTLLSMEVRIDVEDKSTAINIESMQQAQYIRAAFGTQEQIHEIFRKNRQLMVYESVGWRWGAYIFTPMQMVFNVLMCVLGYVLWIQQVEPALIIGAMLSMVNLGHLLFDIGKVMDQIIRSVEDITDLFYFIRGFGKQTYPVLETDTSKNLSYETN